MDHFAHFEFEQLFKEEANKKCFDCGKINIIKTNKIFNKFIKKIHIYFILI
jgi:hypothetical protein